MYYVYRLYDKDDKLLYVGKTTSLETRMTTHKLDLRWKDELTRIEVAQCNSKTDMDIYELYYINKLNPLHNISSVNGDIPTFELKDLEFKPYIKKDKPKIKKPKKKSASRIQKEEKFKLKCNADDVFKITEPITIQELVAHKHKYRAYSIEDRIYFELKYDADRHLGVYPTSKEDIAISFEDLPEGTDRKDILNELYESAKLSMVYKVLNEYDGRINIVGAVSVNKNKLTIHASTPMRLHGLFGKYVDFSPFTVTYK
ncbi:GIY-YIG catalytic domain-containing protein [Peptoclostridium litorale DSM 5388]|uniref:GIY-YIG domain-containing protein n=2 Tax=Peptoclostridium litorale TaxID=1557 RepID=A0A069RIF0_PEPLI|nr:GIY-YIG nuclease family protein [Peptoclostridium litorale]KDR96796.1 hypothetical protein CLIT_20p00090 [Peptoclostridium litorale DSM 5388]SIO36225.1 GIY-YIG catalytic domain-containing protein [Peptoclostridium litorale DSM 5388]